MLSNCDSFTGGNKTATVNLGSSSSHSISSPSTKRRKMDVSSQQTSSKTRVVEARWTVENELQFVTLMYEEVVKGNLVGSKFTNSQWAEISTSMSRCCPDYHYSLKQLRGKFNRLKICWRRYHMLLTKATGFGFEAATGNVVASDDVWAGYLQANPSDLDLRERGLPLYPQLTTIFAPTTATGSAARSSAQDRSQWSEVPGSGSEASDSHAFHHAPRNDINTPSPSLSRPTYSSPSSSKRKKPTESSVANAMNEFALTSKSMRDRASHKEGTYKEAMDWVEELKLPRTVFPVIFKNLVDRESRKLFLSVTSDDYRRSVVEQWAKDAGVPLV